MKGGEFNARKKISLPGFVGRKKKDGGCGQLSLSGSNYKIKMAEVPASKFEDSFWVAKMLIATLL